MDITEFVASQGGIAHRQSVLDAGVRPAALRAAITAGGLSRVRRYWVRTDAAPADLVVAAQHTARLACISAGRHRGWWIPPDATTDLHLHVDAGGRPPAAADVTHWNSPLVPVSAHTLVESVFDALEHIADCLPREQAIVLWESAAREHSLVPRELARVAWRSVAAREIAAILTGQSGSGLETILVVRLRPWGVPIRLQVPLAGHDVDALIGDALVLQLDGFAFHSSSADRTRDLAHDRALVALGYTVLRFSYSEVIYTWPVVERAIARALAQGAHLAR